MPHLTPRQLGILARLLRPGAFRLPARWFLHRISTSHAPPIGRDRYAERSPSSDLPHAAADVSPLVGTLPAQGVLAGPLNGESVVIKDSLDLAGTRTGLGLIDGGDVADQDAELVRRIRAAGGRIIGKAKMTELGSDGLGAVMPYPIPANPAAPGYFAGGSSTGTAVAVASGLARYGVGGDGLGSVRIPSAFCGLVGLKPTHGILPLAGYRSVAPILDDPGPMARNAADCATLWQVLAGEAPHPLEPLRPKRIGLMAQLGSERSNRRVAEAFHRVLDRLGSPLEVVDVPNADHGTLLGVSSALYSLSVSDYTERTLSPAGQLLVALARSLGEEDGRLLAERRERLRESMLRALDRVGVIATPTTAIPPPAMSRPLLVGAQDILLMAAIGTYTPLANCTGVPAIAVPCGSDERGRPLSIMFFGPPNAESDLLRIAMAVESLPRSP